MKTIEKFILGQKDRMTQIFDENGVAVPVTAINFDKNIITAIKEADKDGYSAVQIATVEKKDHKVNKAQKGQFNGKGYQFVKEFRTDNIENYNIGDELEITLFEEGEKVEITSTSKGKGFQGGVKRHGFSGGRRSHGNKHAEREVGSIGAMGPQRVFKGLRSTGRMGSDRITVKNLTIVKVDTENNRIFVKGAIAGKPGTLVELKTVSYPKKA
jgi:large subunit ribosomal protein L3